MEGKTLLAIVLGVLLVCSFFALGYTWTKPAETKEVIVTQPVIVETAYNDTALKADVATIQATLDEDDLWEADAQKLAEAEYTDRHIYNALIDLGILDLDDKDDIDEIVVRDTEVTGTDADEKDADVYQEVRVYYENSDGDSKRVTLDIDTEILEGDVEDTIYALA